MAGGTPRRLETLLEPALARLEAADRLPAAQRGADRLTLGLPDVDRVTGGHGGGDLVVLAGRPGVGVTTLALQVARHASLRRQAEVLLQSRQVPVADLVLRVLAAHGRLRLQRLRRDLDEQQWDRLARTLGEVAAARLVLDHSTTPPSRLLAELPEVAVLPGLQPLCPRPTCTGRCHRTLMPPSTRSTVPVTQAAPGEAR